MDNSENNKIILDKFLRAQTRKKSKLTVTAYRSDLSQFIEFIKDIDITRINELDINNFLESLKNYGQTSRSIKRKLSSIQLFAKFNKIKIKKTENKEIKNTENKNEEDSEIITFLDSFEIDLIRSGGDINNPIYQCIELVLQTGLKISEVINLKFIHFNLKNKTLSIENNRVIFLTNKTFLLLSYLTLNKNPNSFIFSNSKNKKHNIRNLRRYVSDFLDDTGFTDCSINTLRNTFIIHQLKKGVDTNYIAKYVGNTSILSLNRYIKLLEKDYRKITNTILEY